MFDDVRRELRALERGVRVSIPIQLDEGGYLDRRCPWDQCGFTFKVLFADWGSKVRDEAAYCPFCRHEAAAQEYNTPDQVDYLRQAALAEIQQRVGQGLRATAKDFNRRQHPSGGLIAISMHIRVETPPQVVAVPPAAEEAMTILVACEACGCQYAVIGAAYFCPACGHNSAGQVFDQSLAAARATMAALPTTRAAIPERDLAAQVTKGLIENGITSLVTTFQRFAEAEYPRLPHATATPRRNAFQNLQEGSQLWVAAGGTAYSSALDAAEMAALQRLFQQRHLLAHREGIVDQEYIQKSGDPAYAVGQRLVVREGAVLRLAGLLEKLAARLRQDLPS